MNGDDSLLYRVAFSSLRGLTPRLAGDILARVGGEEQFFSFTSGQLAAVMGFNNRLFSDQMRSKALAEGERELDFIRRNHIRALYFTDDSYPRRLLQCDDAPLMLYALGDCDFNAGHYVGVVGTRHATPYGNAFVADLVAGLAERLAEKPVIVSGLAYGVDIAAHKAALEAGIPTIGVLAHGLNTIYPATHRDIAARMVRSGGALVSDYRSLEAIHKGNFLARNRIVAGLCDCLVVAESDVKGGAMVTARLASAYSRDVFALPGRVSDRFSRGCNRLISDCVAQLVSGPDDIIEAMRWPEREPEGVQHELFVELSPDEQAVSDLLQRKGEATLNDIAVAVNMPVARLMGLLIDMEFRNLLMAVPGGRYRPALHT
ncbi:MAG: DNA-processing protein DprA [Duncaniella sp.]|nr:DNA-processing protein DprA [Duncaniella sp.]